MIGGVAMTSAYMRLRKGAQRRMDDTLSISVNGQHRRVPAGSTVADLALELGLEPTRVAVERNLEIVPRSTLAEVRIEDGDDYEIVTFVGGG
jgi:thiamine biosynthesis protein ThiS